MRGGVLAASLLLGGCAEQDCELVFLRSAGADMPIDVCGDPSEAVVVMLHGGPGSGAEATREYFGGIAEHYAVANWSQRAAGASQGNARPETMTPEQMHEDTRQVVQLLRTLHGDPAIFLMSHSWGGAVAAGYLLEYGDDGIAGWISVASDYSVMRTAELSAQWVQREAAERIAAGDDTAYWREAIGWYDDYPSPSHYVEGRHFEHLERLGAEFHGDPEPLYGARDVLGWSSRATGFDILVNIAYSYRELWIDEAMRLDYRAQMGRLTLPVSMMNGRHDGFDPVELAQEGYDAVGTDPSEKEVVIFEHSAHFPMIEEERAFNDAVVAFVDRHR
ncbi:MAG: alpha/beta hydrolase [Myxococcota bacterium]